MIYDKISGTWTPISYVYSKVGDTWKTCWSAFYNVGGYWKVIHQTDHALFGGGLLLDRSVTALTESYIYSNDIVTTTSSLAVATYSLQAVGNYTFGIFAGGCNAARNLAYANTNKYTYAPKTVVATTALLSARAFGCGIGNLTTGIISHGSDDTSPIYTATVAIKYTYSSAVMAYGSTLVLRRFDVAGAGNATSGIIAAGYYCVEINNQDGSGTTNFVEKYQYSSDTISYSGATIHDGRQYFAACGNTTIGIFAGGTDSYYGLSLVNVTDKYTYSSDTSVGLNAPLGSARLGLGGASNSTFGIFTGGAGILPDRISSNYTDKYTFSGDVVTSGTVLGTARDGLAGLSSTPGGFTQ